MQSLISLSEFCIYHQIEIDFVYLLEQRGLIHTTIVEQSAYVQPEQLPRLEKFVRLHQDLNIHTDDLDVVNNLLERIEDLQRRVSRLENRLAFYEPLGE